MKTFASFISGGILGFCQIAGKPLKIQEKINKKISRNRVIFENLLFHSLGIDIEYGFAIIKLLNVGWISRMSTSFTFL